MNLKIRMLLGLIFILGIGNIALAAPPNVDVESFVSQRHIHGITPESAQIYANDRDSIEKLFLILGDQSKSAAWSNAVGVLGYSHDTSVAGRLIAFVENLSGEIDVDAFRGALTVPLALGHLAQNDKANVSILISFVKQEKPLRFTYEHYSGSRLTEVMARLAIQGIGVSGSIEGADYLESNKSTFRKDWSDNVSEALTQIKAQNNPRDSE
jgi:hypothetical protein